MEKRHLGDLGNYENPEEYQDFLVGVFIIFHKKIQIGFLIKANAFYYQICTKIDHVIEIRSRIM